MLRLQSFSNIYLFPQSSNEYILFQRDSQTSVYTTNVCFETKHTNPILFRYENNSLVCPRGYLHWDPSTGKFILQYERKGIYKFKTILVAMSKIGICHWNPRYTVQGNQNMLKDGCETLLTHKKTYCKIYLGNKWNTYLRDPKLSTKYNTLLDCFTSPMYQDVDWSLFTQVVIVAHSMRKSSNYWLTSFTTQDAQEEQKEFYDLACYLRNTYPSTQFILQTWETDHHLRSCKSLEASDRCVFWLTSRQAGVTDAFRENTSKQNVWHCAEVNLVYCNKAWNMVNSVLPKCKVDFISYSAYDSQNSFTSFLSCLDKIQSVSNGARCYIGEFGWKCNQTVSDTNAIISMIRNISAMCQFEVCYYWQLYDNGNKEHENYGLLSQTGEPRLFTNAVLWNEM